MKRQIFTLLMVLVLATGTVLMAQTSPNAPLPPSQQVDQSGQPEQPGHPDVDVDTGKNANNGVLDVDVNKKTDPDTKAQDTDVTDRAAAAAGHDTTTTGTAAESNTMAHDNSNLPATGSEMPLVGLVGLLSLAGVVALRANR